MTTEIPQSVIDEITPELAKFQDSQIARAMAVASGEIERHTHALTADKRTVAERVNDAAIELARDKAVGHVVAVVDEAIGFVRLVAKRRKGADFYVGEQVSTDLVAADPTLLPRIVSHLIRKIREGKLTDLSLVEDAQAREIETAARAAK